MIKLGQFNQAEEFYAILLQPTPNEGEKALLFYKLGRAENGQRKYAEAIGFYDRALQSFQKTLSENHPDLAGSYNNIGNAYKNIGDHSKALLYHEQALEISEKTFLKIILIWLFLTTTSIQ
jgi:tetratricopeptide (TPR) repeat protein